MKYYFNLVFKVFLIFTIKFTSVFSQTNQVGLNGNVGIGTTIPNSLLHTKNGSVLVEGNSGTTPISGGGTRMMWVGEKSAFRFGTVTDNQWNHDSIGYASFAGGYDSKAIGVYSFAHGNLAVARGMNAFALGTQAKANGVYSVAFTTGTANGSYSISLGFLSEASGDNSIAMGYKAKTSYSNSVAIGKETEALGTYSLAIGTSAKASQSYASAIGNNSAANANYAFAIGTNAIANYAYSTAIGSNITAAATKSIVLGVGIDSSTPLVNDNGSSLMVGFNSDIPTLFVSSSSGVGTFGNVGIGTTSPQSTLAVNGKITAKEVEVTLDGWSDFVFEENFNLKPISEVEQYINTNKHLPDVPSEQEVIENGVNLGQMQSILLQKIEELTLYIIQLEKQNRALYNKIELLGKK